MKRDEGHVRAYMRDGTSFCLAVDQYEKLRDRWTVGAAFAEVLGVYGEPITIKLGEVNGLSLLSASMLAEAKGDEEAESLPWTT